MICNNCGSTVKDGAKFCPKCGFSFIVLNSQPPIAPPPYAGQPVYQGGMQGQEPPGEKKNSNKTILIIAIVVAVVVCVVFFLYSQGVFQNLGNRSDNTIGSGSERVVVDDDDKDDQEKEADYSDAYDAYLDELSYNRLVVEDLQESDTMYLPVQLIGGGQIAFADTFGDETPELLYLYASSGANINLKVLTYQESGGLTTILDIPIFTAAGGYGNYCVYLDDNGSLMVYFMRQDEWAKYGFWSAEHIAEYEARGNDSSMFFYNSEDLAQIYSAHGPDETYSFEEFIYMQNGEEISERQFSSAADIMMNSIDRVLFQSTNNYSSDLSLYNMDLWKVITPFREDSMTYNEAIEFLGGDVESQQTSTSTTTASTNPVFPYISASSVREAMGNNSYGPEKAYDDDWSTAWCEGQSGNGVGAWIELSANSKQTVTGIQILNGYCKSEKTYYDNNTISEVRIVTDEGQFSWSLVDMPNTYQEYYFNAPIETKSIRIYLERVNEKGDGLDTLISELSAF